MALPFGARKLSGRHDFAAFRPLFADYLELHKALDIASLDEVEVRGRWKSFVGKWNRGELAEGWYDPEVYARLKQEQRLAKEEAGEEEEEVVSRRAAEPKQKRQLQRGGGGGGGSEGSSSRQPPHRLESEEETDGYDNITKADQDDDEDDDNYGPSLPPQQRAGTSAASRHGPVIPTLQDLAERRETAAAEREGEAEALREARKADRRRQKEQLEELVPRADAGTRERKLEKRQALNAKLNAFREPSPDGAAVPEAELLGGGDGIEEHRKLLAVQQQRTSQRQSRREEEARAAAAERNERIAAYREKEDRTIETLKELARRRFG